MTEPLKIGLAGLGTVGAGLVKLLDENASLISRRAGRPARVSMVSARDRYRDRGIDLSRFGWLDDATKLAERDDVDVVVELIGGSDGPALSLARATLGRGKPLVTANKALLAHHGLELAQLAEDAGAALKFEAAVGGGIPVIKGLREGAAANSISRVFGILNGTCNYILTEMESRGLPFQQVLAQAQQKGYAEADPSFDIDGVDAAHKLSLLASLAFGTQVDFDHVAVQGIRQVEIADISHAEALGFRVRLIGLARVEDGALFQRVHPCLVPSDHPIAKVGGALNAVVVEGNFVGRLFFEGRGAGEGPTASAVAADLVDVARGELGPALSMPVSQLSSLAPASQEDHIGRYYIRLTVTDQPGVLAELTAALRDEEVSIESLIQRGHSNDRGVFVVMVTHVTRQRAVSAALERMCDSGCVIGGPMMMHILDFDA